MNTNVVEFFGNVPRGRAEAALWYAEKMKWRVMPLHSMRTTDGVTICSCGQVDCVAPGKHPLVRNGEASNDPEVVKKWWQRFPYANVGFWLENSGLAVLDIDVGAGKDGAARLREILGDTPLQETLVCCTPSKGKHIYYKEREGLPNKSNALGEGLDIWRGRHYVILPPSNHKAGTEYRWEKAAAPIAWPDILMPQRRPVGRPPKIGKPREFDSTNPDERARLAYSLTYIDASDRDTWVQTLYAIARAFNWNDEGFQIANEWSATASNYNAEKTHTIYHKDSKNQPQGVEPITVASIFDRAKKNPTFIPWEKHDDRLPFVNIPDNRGVSLDALNELVVRASLPICARGSLLIDIIQFKDMTEVEIKRLAARQIKVPAGTPLLRELTVGRFEDIASKEIVWREVDAKGNLRSSPYKGTTVAAFLERGRWPGIKLFRAFVQHLTIRSLEDRSIIREPGLDEESGLYLTDSLSIDVPERKLNRKDALAAVKVILKPFSKYRFVDQSLGEAIVIAAILTSLLRHCFRTVPGIAIEAATPRSGKTKMAQAIGIVALGRRVPMTTYTPNEEEMEKRMGALKMMGIRDVLLDNVKTRMDSASIESMITEERSMHRVLGYSEEVELVNDGMIYVTGNGMTMSRDMRRRFLTLIIDSGRQVEASKRGDFDFDPPDLALKMRPTIIAAALTVVKAFEDAKGNVGLNAQPVASFEDWSYIRDVLLWLGYADLGNALEENLADDEDGASYDKDSVLFWMAKNVPESGWSAEKIIDKLMGTGDAEWKIRNLLLRHKSPWAIRNTDDLLTPKFLHSALQKLEVLNASWPLTIDGRVETVFVRKTGSIYRVKKC